jgi:hypothetical protein
MRENFRVKIAFYARTENSKNGIRYHLASFSNLKHDFTSTLLTTGLYLFLLFAKNTNYASFQHPAFFLC